MGPRWKNHGYVNLTPVTPKGSVKTMVPSEPWWKDDKEVRKQRMIRWRAAKVAGRTEGKRRQDIHIGTVRLKSRRNAQKEPSDKGQFMDICLRTWIGSKEGPARKAEVYVNAAHFKTMSFDERAVRIEQKALKCQLGYEVEMQI